MYNMRRVAWSQAQRSAHANTRARARAPRHAPHGARGAHSTHTVHTHTHTHTHTRRISRPASVRRHALVLRRFADEEEDDAAASWPLTGAAVFLARDATTKLKVNLLA